MNCDVRVAVHVVGILNSLKCFVQKNVSVCMASSGLLLQLLLP